MEGNSFTRWPSIYWLNSLRKVCIQILIQRKFQNNHLLSEGYFLARPTELYGSLHSMIKTDRRLDDFPLSQLAYKTGVCPPIKRLLHMVAMKSIYHCGTRKGHFPLVPKWKTMGPRSENEMIRYFLAKYGALKMSIVILLTDISLTIYFQVHNDNLGLRQPIRITSLSYIDSDPSLATPHLLAGTQLGSLRRYDTRSARRPVSDWKIAKVGGVKIVQKGLSEQCVVFLILL